MAGSAILDPAVLVDDLVGSLIDDLRNDLHPIFGVRAFRVFVVVRTWASGDIGEGSFTDTETELIPQPLVEPYRTSFTLEPCGVDEAGFIVLREVSLSYTEMEISGPPSDNQDFLIKIADAHGQATPDRFYTVSRRPYPDRIKDMGWKMELTPASTPEGA